MIYTHNIDPVFFSLGPLEIRWYGLFYVIGFLFAYWYLHYRREQIDFTKEQIGDYIFWVMLGGVLGARLFHVLVWQPIYYLSNPLKIFFVWEGGMAVHGGYIGVALVTYFFCKKHGKSFWKMADLVTIPAIFGLALGRVGNFMNGEIWGPETTVAWCVVYDGVCRHAYPIYAFLKRVLIGGVLIIYYPRKHFDGAMVSLLLILTGLGRFVLDFWRVDLLYYGLSTGQWVSLVFLVGGIYLWFKLKKKK